MTQPTTITIHCSDTLPDWWAGETLWAKRMEIRRWHVDGRGWRDIGYHWLIDRDGEEVKGRDLDHDDDPWEHTGAHVGGHNTGNLGICLLGGYGSHEKDDFRDHFTAEQEEALIRRIEKLREMFPSIKRVCGHNEFAAKACPGFDVQQWYPQARKDYLTSGAAPEVAVEPRPFEAEKLRRHVTTLETQVRNIEEMAERTRGTLERLKAEVEG